MDKTVDEFIDGLPDEAVAQARAEGVDIEKVAEEFLNEAEQAENQEVTLELDIVQISAIFLGATVMGNQGDMPDEEAQLEGASVIIEELCEEVGTIETQNEVTFDGYRWTSILVVLAYGAKTGIGPAADTINMAGHRIKDELPDNIVSLAARVAAGVPEHPLHQMSNGRV